MISVTILTKNSQKYLRDVLAALAQFPEVIILDSGSSDETLAIAAEFSNVKIHRSSSFDGFGVMHNRATALATHDWVFSVDSDEIASPELVQEIMTMKLDRRTVYSVARHNYYKGKFIRGCGWYPDRVVRLYHRQETRFSSAQVHEAVICDQLRLVTLRNALSHYSYGSTADFINKMQVYTDLFAAQNRGKKTSSTCKAVLHGLFAFCKSYLLQRGLLLGREGFEISVYQANTAFYKYIKLLEANTHNRLLDKK